MADKLTKTNYIIDNKTNKKINNESKALQSVSYYDCIVAGGGAAGMMAAITAARNGASVAIVEHTKRIGSKILQTGNGKCNFTNLNMSAGMFQNDNKEFVNTVLSAFDENAVIDFFRELGVYHKERNGYVYPHSETAASLQDALRFELERLGVEVFLECEITDIKSEDLSGDFSDGDNLYRYFVEIMYDKEETEDKKTKECRAIYTKTFIIATGSKAAPKTGSDGSGYKLAKGLGHRIKKPLPALVQLESDLKHCKAMAGVRSIGKVQLFVDGELVSEDTGEVQYTDYGISGIPVFQISRYAVCAVDRKSDVRVCIDMLPDMSKEVLFNDVRVRYEIDLAKNVEQFFAGLINKKLVSVACKIAGADPGKQVAEFAINKMYKVIEVLKAFEFNITSYKGFDNAQICQGGVVLDDINPDTMESLKCKGIFFAGEVLDVDGKCGGYNLQWAWSSGFVAGLNAAVSSIDV